MKHPTTEAARVCAETLRHVAAILEGGAWPPEVLPSVHIDPDPPHKLVPLVVRVEHGGAAFTLRVPCTAEGCNERADRLEKSARQLVRGLFTPPRPYRHSTRRAPYLKALAARFQEDGELTNLGEYRRMYEQ